MKRIHLLRIAASLVGGLAFASHTAAKAEPAAIFNWTGFYAGADAGVLFGDSSVTLPGADAAKPDGSGFVYGGHIGYRYQFPTNWVAGIEGQLWATSGYEGSAKYLFASNNEILDVKRGYTVLGTLGYAVHPQLLLYGAAGWSDAHYNACVTLGSACGGAYISGDSSAFTYGGGVAILVNPNLILRFQYLFADYGDKAFHPPSFATSVVDLRTTTITAGLSWKFGN